MDEGPNEQLTDQIDTYLDLLHEMAEEGHESAIKMADIMFVGRAAFCRAVVRGNATLVQVRKGYPGFTIDELIRLANDIRVRAAIERLE